MATLDEFKVIAAEEIEAAKPLYKDVNGVVEELSDEDYEQAIKDSAKLKHDMQNNDWFRSRGEHYPSSLEFIEAYTEKEILGDTTKWDSYVEKYNQVRTDYPKPTLTDEELINEFTEET